jgi:hypothetical protein
VQIVYLPIIFFVQVAVSMQDSLEWLSHPSDRTDDIAGSLSTTQSKQWTLCDLPKGSFDPHEDNQYTRLLRSLASCNVFWEGDVHRASLAELLLSFIEFGNEDCARACAAAFERDWGPLPSHPELASDIRFEAARSGKLSILNLALATVGGPPLNIRDMLIAGRTGHARLVEEICAVLPCDVCEKSFTYIREQEVDCDDALLDETGCRCLACSIFEHMPDFECFVAVCLNWTFDEDSVRSILKSVGGLLWKLPAAHIQGIYKKCNSGCIFWMEVDALRHIMAYWPQPVLFLRGLIPDVDEFPDAFLHAICQGLLVGQLREAQLTLKAGDAADFQRTVICLNTGLDLPVAIADAMPLIVSFL